MGAMNELTVNIQHSILTLAGNGWSNRRIARELGINRETVGNDCDRLGGGPAQDGDEFVKVFGLSAQGQERDVIGKQPGQSPVVTVEVEALPRDAPLVEPAGAGGGFDAFAHVAFGLNGQYQAMFYCFHMFRLNRLVFVVLSLMVVVGGV